MKRKKKNMTDLQPSACVCSSEMDVFIHAEEKKGKRKRDCWCDTVIGHRVIVDSNSGLVLQKIKNACPKSRLFLK